MAAISSGKIGQLQADLAKMQAGLTDITQSYNRLIASYGLAEPLVGVGTDSSALVSAGRFPMNGRGLAVDDAVMSVVR